MNIISGLGVVYCRVYEVSLNQMKRIECLCVSSPEFTVYRHFQVLSGQIVMCLDCDLEKIRSPDRLRRADFVSWLTEW